MPPRFQEQPGRFGAPATQNANGTINWRALYGEEAFRLNPPLFESELQKMRAEAGPDFSAIEKQAREFAEMRRKNPNAMMPQQQINTAPQIESSPAKGGPDELPAGWSTAKDPAGRVYYWHTKTKKTMWDRPTAETPIQ